MTNGDYNPPPHHLNFLNDRKQAIITIAGLAVVAILISLLLILYFR